AIAEVKNPKAVGQWARGTRAPHAPAERRLRDAFQVVLELVRVEEPATIRAWFLSMNPLLEDELPAWALARDPVAVLKAARRRAVCRLRATTTRERSFLDLCALPTLVILRGVFAARLVELGLRDLDTSGVRGPSRALTQAIAAWAYDEGYDGIAYKSRFDDA